MGGRAEGLTCTDPGARTPIGVSGNFPLRAVVAVAAVVTLLAFTPEGVVVGF